MERPGPRPHRRPSGRRCVGGRRDEGQHHDLGHGRFLGQLRGDPQHDLRPRVGTWVDDVNAHGGINGRKVIAKKIDNKDTVEGGVAACKTIKTNGSYLAVSIVGSAAPTSARRTASTAPALRAGPQPVGWSSK